VREFVARGSDCCRRTARRDGGGRSATGSQSICATRRASSSSERRDKGDGTNGRRNYGEPSPDRTCGKLKHAQAKLRNCGSARRSVFNKAGFAKLHSERHRRWRRHVRQRSERRRWPLLSSSNRALSPRARSTSFSTVWGQFRRMVQSLFGNKTAMLRWVHDDGFKTPDRHGVRFCEELISAIQGMGGLRQTFLLWDGRRGDQAEFVLHANASVSRRKRSAGRWPTKYCSGTTQTKLNSITLSSGPHGAAPAGCRVETRFFLAGSTISRANLPMR